MPGSRPIQPASGIEGAGVRALREADFEAVVRLNDSVVQQTSAMDPGRLRELHSLPGYHRVINADGRVVAFLLAMRETAPYRNDNFEWFASRFEKFVYVDRIVVMSEWARQGLGTSLYRDLFDFAQASGLRRVVCEYNIDPPNLPSRAFHDKFGFREVGRQRVAGGSKLVSLQAAGL